jgi:hypothetical protein
VTDEQPRHAAGPSRSRLPTLAAVAVLVGAVVAAGVALDRREPDVATAAEVTPADLAPVAPGAGAVGSTWFCAGGTGRDGGAVHRVHVGNPGDDPVPVTVTVIPGALRGEQVTARQATETFEVEPGESETLLLADVVDAPFLSAVVEAGAGQVAVEHSIARTADGAAGESATPCASAASTTAYLAAGTTTRDAVEQLLLFNPFPDDAVVDVTFATPEGLREPTAFAGLIVPARRVLAVDVGEVVSRHANVSASIVARTGRFVADRIQRFDGSGDGPAGLALTGAARAPASVWRFPDGRVDEGVGEVVTVFNPTERQAEVDVEVNLDPTDDLSQPAAAEPFPLTVPPGQFAQIDVAQDGRVPPGRGHSLTVRSQNGVEVVAERWLRRTADAGGPGLGATLGSPVDATRWLAAAGAVEGGVEQLVIANPSLSEIARVAVTSPSPSGAGALAGLGELQVAPAGRVVVDLTDALGDQPLVLVVQADLPVVVERVTVGPPGDDDAPGGRGQSIVLPVESSATVPDVDPGEVPTGPLPTVPTTTTSSSSTTSTSTTTTSTTSTTSTTAPGATTTTAAPP